MLPMYYYETMNEAKNKIKMATGSVRYIYDNSSSRDEFINRQALKKLLQALETAQVAISEFDDEPPF